MVTYTTVAKVASYLGETIDATTTPSTTEVGEFIDRAEAEIDDMTGTSYQTQTATAELYDYDRYSVFVKEPVLHQVGRVDSQFTPTRNSLKLNNYPIISITSLEVNQGTHAVPNWKSLTENTDFVVYKDEGNIVFLRSDALPVEDLQGIKTTYTYGHAAVPLTVEKLCTLMAVKEVLRSKQANSSFATMDSITIETISITKSTQESVELLQSINDEIELLKKEIIGMINYWVV